MRWGDLIVEGDARRLTIRERHGNGVDGVEVRHGGGRLAVFFLDHAPHGVEPGNVRIDPPAGGTPVRAMAVRRAAEEDRELEDRLVVELDRPGSAGPYRLQIVERRADGTPGTIPYRGLDPRFAGARFVFDLDTPWPPLRVPPAGARGAYDDISYLLRDYEGFRQLMLDRLATTLAAWAERHAADSWMTLVELLAYAGDDLSYHQDAVATEAYLQTARRRVSVRRHARLVGYRLHDGCHARAWVSVQVAARVALPLGAVRFAAVDGTGEARPPLVDAPALPAAERDALRQYSPLPVAGRARELVLRPAHNSIELWSWGERDSRLAAGATSAVLADTGSAEHDGHGPRRALSLRPGDVLVLEETGDPASGGVAPPDPAHRQAVRLTEVQPLADELYGQPLLEVRWAQEDALTFELAVTAGGRACAGATGNVLLVGHGVPVTDGRVPLAQPALTATGLTFTAPFPDDDLVARHQARRLRALYRDWRREIWRWWEAAARGTPLSGERLDALRAQLGEELLTRLGLAAGEYEDTARRQADGLAELLARADRLLAERRRRLELLARLAEASGPLSHVLVDELENDWGRALTRPLGPGRPGSWGPAADALVQDPRAALPVLELFDDDGRTWHPRADLIGVAPGERAVVVEVDDHGGATLRLNAPPAGGTLEARYWIGNGTEGNAEAEAINAVLWPGGPGIEGLAAIVAVRNPLPAVGGTDPEDATRAKHAIPGAFAADQPRALVAADYAELARAVRGVRRAAAQMLFTGSRPAVDVAVQPAVGEDPAATLLATVERALERVRRIGHVVRVRAPRYRPLVLGLDVALVPEAVRSDVADELARVLSSGWLRDGSPGLFNPGRLGFGASVYASAVIAAVHRIAGVRSAVLTSFGFLAEPAAAGIRESLSVGALEIPRLDNDPAAPDRGYTSVVLEGGR